MEKGEDLTMEILNEKIQSSPGLILKLLDRAGWSYKKIGNVYMGACPVCKNGTRSPNTKFNLDTNSFKCFNDNCGASGGLKEVAENLGIDFREFLIDERIIEDKKLPERDKQYQDFKRDKMQNKGIITNEEKKERKIEIDLEKISTAVLDEEVKNYLLSRYIDPDAVKSYVRMVRPEQDKSFSYLENYFKEGYKLLIPAFDHEGNLKSVKIRNVRNGEGPKVKNLKGLKQSAIGIDGLKESINDYVIVVEGEIDYLTGIYLSPGDDFIAIPSSTYTFTTEEKETLPEKVVLLLDNDEAGKSATERIATDLKKEGKKVYIGQYPEGIKDLNELLARYEGNTDKALEELQEILFMAYQNPFTLTKTLKETGKSLIKRLRNRVEEAEKEGRERPDPLAFKTGLNFLDELLDGGLRRGLYAIAGQPAIGKTSFILALAKHLAENGNNALIFSLEMTDEDLLIQLLSWLTGVNKRRILDETVNRFELEEIEEAMGSSIFDHIFIDTESRTIEDIEKKVIDTLNDVEGSRLVVFIDYLQQIKPSKELLKSDYRLQMKDISYKLKEIANRYNLPLFVISSTQRDGYNSGSNKDKQSNKKEKSEPNYIAMFKESGDIEYSLYAGYYLDYPSKEDLEGFIKSEGELPIKIVKVKSRFGSVRDKDHKHIYKIAILDFKSGELQEYMPI